MKPSKPAEEAQPRLGRGLAALLGGAGAIGQGMPQPARGPKKIPIEFLRPNPRNPRRIFGEEDLGELTAFDQGERHYPADSRAPRARYCRHVRDHRWRAPLAGGATRRFA